MLRISKSFPLFLTSFALFPLLVACQTHKAPVVNANPFVTLTGPAFIRQWDFQLQLFNGESAKNIYLADGVVHVLTDQNIDHALLASSGDLQYFNQIAPTDLAIHGGPVALPDHVVFATARSLEVYKTDGKFETSIDMDGGLSSPPVGFDNLIFVGLVQETNRLAAVDVEKPINPKIWEVLANGRIAGAAAVYNKEIYFASEDGAVIGVDEDRSPLWPLLDGYKFQTGDQILGDIKADKFGVYAASTDRVLYCISRMTGKIIWRFFAGAPLNTGPDVTASTVYQFIPRKGLAAIDKSVRVSVQGLSDQTLGEEPIHTARWIASNATRLLAEDDRYSYVLSTDNTILGLDKQTGQQVFASTKNDFVSYATNLHDSTIYAVTAQGWILAITPALNPGMVGQLVQAERPISFMPISAQR